ncbi:MAG: penicillin-binding transpeptidase domain-containing protein [Chloroflexota bacterium]|nr:penicillin-binding transpeptidase domain-containing protein [Chloroflexota bacterium]
MFIVVLTIVVLLFVLLVQLDTRSVAAVSSEAIGATRGSFDDRNGMPLLFTRLIAGRPSRVSVFPDLDTLLGYRDSRGAWHGLESRYGSLLDARAARQDWRTVLLHLSGHAARGGSVRLTLDMRLQAAAERALGKHLGAIVAIDPRTGGVLAMATRPACSSVTLASGAGESRCRKRPDSPLLNRATQLIVPPGSSFKIVTLSAAFDTGRFTLDSIFSGADVFGPSPYFDNVEYPSNVTRTDLVQLTLAQALAFSDNFTFAHIGLTLGSDTLLRYAHRFGVGRHIPFDLPLKSSIVADGQLHPDLSVLARSSFGGSPDRVSPLQMALIASAVANRGVLMAPHLVQETLSASGHVLTRYRTHPMGRVMSEQAAREVTTWMVFVVDHGSGFPAQIPGVEVAGKTGTAVSGGARANAWFIAFAPARQPVVAVAVLRQFSGEGFKFAAPLAHQVLLAALREHSLQMKPSPAPKR